MADTKRNALAELAEDLEILKVILESEHHPKGVQVAYKAQCIIAELAGIEPGRILGGRFDLNSLLNLETVYEKCRAIAEEGAE